MNDNRVNDILNKEIEADHTAYEMAVSLHDASAQIINRAGTFLEHFFKVRLFPNDISQNKWRTELATKLKECAKFKSSATNKKFDETVYQKLFRAFAGDEDEFAAELEDFLTECLKEGFSAPVVSLQECEQLFQLFRKFENYVIPLMTQKDNYSVEFYEQRISEIL